MHVTMTKTKTIAAGRFKAECLALLDRVQQTGEPLIVTKRGVPVARVVPVTESKPRSLLGSVQTIGDLLEPLDEGWDVER